MASEKELTWTPEHYGWCKYSDRLWKGEDCAFKEILRLTKLFSTAAYYGVERFPKAVRRLEGMFFVIKANWIRLDGIMRCAKHLPCDCSRLQNFDISQYNIRCEIAWNQVYKCAKMLADIKVEMGVLDRKTRMDFLDNLAMTKTMKNLPNDVFS